MTSEWESILPAGVTLAKTVSGVPVVSCTSLIARLFHDRVAGAHVVEAGGEVCVRWLVEPGARLVDSTHPDAHQTCVELWQAVEETERLGHELKQLVAYGTPRVPVHADKWKAITGTVAGSGSTVTIDAVEVGEIASFLRQASRTVGNALDDPKFVEAGQRLQLVHWGADSGEMIFAPPMPPLVLTCEVTEHEDGVQMQFGWNDSPHYTDGFLLQYLDEDTDHWCRVMQVPPDQSGCELRAVDPPQYGCYRLTTTGSGAGGIVTSEPIRVSESARAVAPTPQVVVGAALTHDPPDAAESLEVGPSLPGGATEVAHREPVRWRRYLAGILLVALAALVAIWLLLQRWPPYKTDFHAVITPIGGEFVPEWRISTPGIAETDRYVLIAPDEYEPRTPDATGALVDAVSEDDADDSASTSIAQGPVASPGRSGSPGLDSGPGDPPAGSDPVSGGSSPRSGSAFGGSSPAGSESGPGDQPAGSDAVAGGSPPRSGSESGGSPPTGSGSGRGDSSPRSGSASGGSPPAGSGSGRGGSPPRSGSASGGSPPAASGSGPGGSPAGSGSVSGGSSPRSGSASGSSSSGSGSGSGGSPAGSGSGSGGSLPTGPGRGSGSDRPRSASPESFDAADPTSPAGPPIGRGGETDAFVGPAQTCAQFEYEPPNAEHWLAEPSEIKDVRLVVGVTLYFRRADVQDHQADHSDQLPIAPPGFAGYGLFPDEHPKHPEWTNPDWILAHFRAEPMLIDVETRFAVDWGASVDSAMAIARPKGRIELHDDRCSWRWWVGVESDRSANGRLADRFNVRFDPPMNVELYDHGTLLQVFPQFEEAPQSFRVEVVDRSGKVVMRSIEMHLDVNDD